MSTDESSLPSVLDVKSRWEQISGGGSEDQQQQLQKPPSPRPGVERSQFQSYSGPSSSGLDDIGAGQRANESSPNLTAVNNRSMSEGSGEGVAAGGLNSLDMNLHQQPPVNGHANKPPKPIVAPKPARLTSNFANLNLNDGHHHTKPVPPPQCPHSAPQKPTTPDITVSTPPAEVGLTQPVASSHTTGDGSSVSSSSGVAPPPPPPPRSSTPRIQQQQSPILSAPGSPINSNTTNTTAKPTPPPPPPPRSPSNVSNSPKPVQSKVMNAVDQLDAQVNHNSHQHGPATSTTLTGNSSLAPPSSSPQDAPATPPEPPQNGLNNENSYFHPNSSPNRSPDPARSPSASGGAMAPPPPPPPRRVPSSQSNPHLPMSNTSKQQNHNHHHQGSISTENLSSLVSSNTSPPLPPNLPPRPSRSVSPHARTPAENSVHDSHAQQYPSVPHIPPMVVQQTPPFTPQQSTYHGEEPTTDTEYEYDYDDADYPSTDDAVGYPDSSQANRRAPIYQGVMHDVHTRAEVKSVAVYGRYLCVAALNVSIYDLETGEQVWTMSLNESKVTAVGFKPSQNNDILVVWLGTKDGQIWEVHSDQPGKIMYKRPNVHLTPLVLIQRNGYFMWTLSDDGKIGIWDGELTDLPKTYRVTPNFKALTAVGSQLWVGRNRQTNIYQPSTDNSSQFLLTPRPLPSFTNPSGRQAGEFSCAGRLKARPDLVFFGHEEGSVTIYSQSKMVALESVNVSSHRVCSIKGVGQYLWIGLKNGNILVCDVGQRPWKVLKEWKAHEGPVTAIHCYDASLTSHGNLPVVSFSTENSVNIWDGLLKQDWIETDMQRHKEEYSSFSDIKVQVVTWNSGAAKPSDLEANKVDKNFLHDTLTGGSTGEQADVIVFGFQELVELDNKSVTAKSVFSKKKKQKDVDTSSHISHQYKAWQDCLFFAICENMSEPYKLVHSNNMVGLFTCVFIKESLLPRMRSVESSSVKTGLGGLHGNKGGLAVRLIVDDSSICFVNVHLAAGQSGASQRNKDIETVLETQFLEDAANSKLTGKGIFVNGGDGTMILDHEICFFSGDMNYRINLHRPAAMKAIQDGDIQTLLSKDQLLDQLNKNPGMRLRIFQESPISFLPTYKFDLGTDQYDSSEKKRVPAWCDRIFYRGANRISPLDYQSHTVRVSDHRPVSGLYQVQVKTIDTVKRNETYKACLDRWDQYLERAVDLSRATAGYD